MRLDRESEAKHDMGRLSDESVGGEAWTLYNKIAYTLSRDELAYKPCHDYLVQLPLPVVDVGDKISVRHPLLMNITE